MYFIKAVISILFIIFVSFILVGVGYEMFQSYLFTTWTEVNGFKQWGIFFIAYVFVFVGLNIKGERNYG